MKKQLKLKCQLIILGLAFLSNFNIYAQFTLESDYNSELNGYHFSVHGNDDEELGPNDLVYYRFSDGYFMTKENIDGDGAKIFRQFEGNEDRTVIAYVAKKNDTLGKANSVTVTPEEDGISDEVSNPVIIIPNGGNIHLSTSWQPFTESSALQQFIDDGVEPSFTTPEETPWFFLNVTIQPTSTTADSEVEIELPSLLTTDGIVIENQWIELTDGEDPNVITNSFVNSIIYNDNKITLDMSSSFDAQVSAFILVKGDLPLLETFDVFATIRDRKGYEETDELPLRVVKNPHDPNRITTDLIGSNGLCISQSEHTPIEFFIEFQNYGEYDAEDIIVRIDLDEEIFDVSTIEILNASHEYEQLTDAPEVIEFIPIDLPGTNQTYPNIAPVFETKGWLTFQVTPLSCFSTEDDITSVTGEIEFRCPSCDEYIEFTPLNEIKIKIDKLCPIDPECTNIGGGINTRSVFIDEDAPNLPDFSIDVYPTIFQEALNMKVITSNKSTGVTVRLVDINGQIWLEDKIPTDMVDDYEGSVDTHHLPLGMYILQINQGKHQQFRKVIKQ